jgi:YYY domain-containing protein
MVAVLSWWLIMEMLGLLALPLVWRMLQHLPERGYAFAKPLGLLVVGYLFWIGGSLGLLSNSRTAILFCMMVLGLASLWVWLKNQIAIRKFVSDNWRMIVACELVFALAFVGWSLVRAYNPDIAATEKPMEIAFLNAILRSERFPPHDPWLSGFAISYYYFGYLLMALLTKLSGVAASVAFNLAIALLFGLTALGSFGLAYNLIGMDRGREVRNGVATLLWALLGPLFVAVIGNLEGLFEVLHTRGLGSPRFWQWLDVSGLIDAPVNGRWVPTDAWWWWRASRVVNDRDLRGVHMEVIDEFPQFSFLLGDMHPHVLALPFVLLVLGIALNTLLGSRKWAANMETRQKGSEAEKLPQLRRTTSLMRLMWHDLGPDLLLTALCLGALGFLNTWDLPIHLCVVVAAFGLGQLVQHRKDWWLSSGLFALSVAAPAAVLYLPFYLGFQSQAGGALPLFFNVTRVHQYLMMFGIFVFVILSLIVLRLGQIWKGLPHDERRRFVVDLGSPLVWLIVGPLLLMGLAVASVMLTTSGKQFLRGVLENQEVQSLIRATGVSGLLQQAVVMRLAHPWTLLLIFLLLAGLWYLLQHLWRTGGTGDVHAESALLFVELIAGVAFLLTLVVEFIYLRDLFGTRMNTVFKFYYQAWVMMAISAAYGTYHILGRAQAGLSGALRLGRSTWALVLCVLIAAGMIYPLLAIPNRADGFKGQATLDGMVFLQNVRPDDYDAIRWLQANVSGMAYIVESSGGSYTDVSFVSAFTGLPTILGWDFHQFQWRGNTIESGKRQPDIAQIYQSSTPSQVLALLDKYDVEYVYLGAVEKRNYGVSPQAEDRFGRFLETVYQGGGVSIYRR